MERLGVAERSAPLAGDLEEEFQNGRSAFWYWRQAVVAIVLVCVGNLRSGRNLPVLAGFLVQIAGVCALRRFDWPHRRPAWGIFLGLLYVPAGVCGLLARRRLTGYASRRHPFPMGAFLTTCGTLVRYLGWYPICACFVKWTLFELAIVQSPWFVGCAVSRPDSARSDSSKLSILR
jgi:hypothetical protein